MNNELVKDNVVEVKKRSYVKKQEESSESLVTEVLNHTTVNITIEEEKAAAQRKRDLRIVRGMFKCNEQQGGMLKFSFKKKYKDVPLKSYHFFDGETYEIPYMVADHINKTCWYPVHRYLTDEDGKITSKIGQKIARYSFIPLDFMLDNDSDKNIITVQKL